MASSPLENYHRQLNRLSRLIHGSENSMHAFLMLLMFRWNVDRRRKLKLERDWRTYDLALVNDAYQASVRAINRAETAKLWGGEFALPQQLATTEHFGIFHPHVTLSQRMAAAEGHMPFSLALLKCIHSRHPVSGPPSSVFVPSSETIIVNTVSIPASPPALPARSPLHFPRPSTPGDVAPLHRMTEAELRITRELISRDPLMAAMAGELGMMQQCDGTARQAVFCC